MVKVAIDGVAQEGQPDELLIDLINRTGVSVPHVCYHPQLGPVQTCDTCMVEVSGRLVRACATEVADGMKVSTKSAKASAAQVEAFDRILSTHLLYCAPRSRVHAKHVAGLSGISFFGAAFSGASSRNGSRESSRQFQKESPRRQRSEINRSGFSGCFGAPSAKIVSAVWPRPLTSCKPLGVTFTHLRVRLQKLKQSLEVGKR